MIKLSTREEYQVQLRAKAMLTEDRKTVKLPKYWLYVESAVANSLKEIGHDPRFVDMPTRLRIVRRLRSVDGF